MKTLAVYLTFYKLNFFETFIIFLERTINLIRGIFDCKSHNNSYFDCTSVFFDIFSKTDRHPNAVDNSDLCVCLWKLLTHT